MFEYLFPIFCFGLLITAIVAKGVFMANEFAKSAIPSGNQAEIESPESLFAHRSHPSPSVDGSRSGETASPPAIPTLPIYEKRKIQPSRA